MTDISVMLLLHLNMKVAVNTRLLIKNKLDGIGWFTHETLKRITKSHPEHTFYFVFDRPYDKQFIYESNVIPIVVGPPARHPILWYLWFEFSLPSALKKIQPDVFLSTDGYLPMKSPMPKVDVIHDINFEHFPGILPKLTSKYYRKYFPRYAQDATRVATVSEFSKRDISEKYKISTEKLDVVYNGVNEVYAKYAGCDKKEMQEKYCNGFPYIIFVGTIQERKNISNMFKAFDLFKKKRKSDHKLLIAGRKMWWSAEMEQTLNEMEYKNDVVITGRIENTEELSNMVASSELMLYVPVFEGFGVPVLEAQLAQIPVITSNTSCLPEIGGAGAQYCDPFSHEEISQSLEEVLFNEELRLEVVEKGKVNVGRFSWEDTAERLWSSIEKASNGKA